MENKKVYIETAKLIKSDLKEILMYVGRFATGLFIGALGVFIFPLGIKMQEECTKKGDDYLLNAGIILSIVSILISGILVLVKDNYKTPINWTLFKVILTTHGLYFVYWLGKQFKNYLKNKEEMAIELINAKKRETK